MNSSPSRGNLIDRSTFSPRNANICLHEVRRDTVHQWFVFLTDPQKCFSMLSSVRSLIWSNGSLRLRIDFEQRIPMHTDHRDRVGWVSYWWIDGWPNDPSSIDTSIYRRVEEINQRFQIYPSLSHCLSVICLATNVSRANDRREAVDHLRSSFIGSPGVRGGW